MDQFKKICIKRFDSMQDAENFYNKFSPGVKIVSTDIKPIKIGNQPMSFMMTLEYIEKSN